MRSSFDRKKAKLTKDDSGYALIGVLMLMIAAAIILVPLLLVMTAGVTSSHLHEERMLRFYAADAGIEDAAYKIQSGMLPQSYPYYIEVNGNEVSVTVENVWLLQRFETDAHGTMPHREFMTAVDQPEDGTYEIDVVYTGPGTLKIDRIAAWLPGGFEYIAGSSNIRTTLSKDIDACDTDIGVDSTDLFPAAGVILIDSELIQYTEKTANRFKDCIRGYGGTTAASHSIGTEVTAEPEIIIGSGGEDPFIDNTYGGTVLRWNFPSLPRLEDLPSSPTLRFEYTPEVYLDSTFAWVRTNEFDIYLSWSGTFGFYDVTATAQDEDGKETTLMSQIMGTDPVEIDTYTIESYQGDGSGGY